MQRFRSVVEFAAQLYRYVVLDVPRADGAALDALGSASQIVVVANQELAAARSASRLAAALRERYGRDRVLVIVSRVDKQAEITQADIEKVVGSKIRSTCCRATIGWRWTRSTGAGRWPSTTTTQLAAGFRGLARSLAKIEPEPQKKEPGGSFFGRLTGRG